MKKLKKKQDKKEVVDVLMTTDIATKRYAKIYSSIEKKLKKKYGIEQVFMESRMNEAHVAVLDRQILAKIKIQQISDMLRNTKYRGHIKMVRIYNYYCLIIPNYKIKEFIIDSNIKMYLKEQEELIKQSKLFITVEEQQRIEHNIVNNHIRFENFYPANNIIPIEIFSDNFAIILL